MRDQAPGAEYDLALQEPADARVAAFFDLDHTVLHGSSGMLFVRDMWRRKRMSTRQILDILRAGLLYKLGRADFTASSREIMRAIAGFSEEEMWHHSQAWFQELVAPRLAPGAGWRIAAHRARGHQVALLSASTVFATVPVAESFGLAPSAAIATRLEVVDGQLTGEVVEPMCYGAGKVFWAERWAADRDIDLGRSFFYTDSISDLPMLRRVAHPVAVNPDPRLRRLARRSNWPIVRFY
ncbi:MAG: HAD family hydrolase [Anaerolineae bacterium]|nr:HAD family hydrolase [Anaerolineae bacterium]